LNPPRDAANQARQKYGRKKAIAMLALKISRHSGQDIAAIFGTTRGAVYQRLFRLRAGRYTG
jgi:biotin operon repressor